MHLLKKEKYLPIKLEAAWSFFSTPKNLNKITPKELVFEITSDVPDTIYEGLIITYRIKPMLNISMNWCTEITHIKEYSYFIDEQRSGPYKLWHHEHHFETLDNGVRMTDIVHYDIGKSLFGAIAGKLFIHNKVEEIFEYRAKVLDKYFSIPK